MGEQVFVAAQRSPRYAAEMAESTEAMGTLDLQLRTALGFVQSRAGGSCKAELHPDFDAFKLNLCPFVDFANMAGALGGANAEIIHFPNGCGLRALAPIE